MALINNGPLTAYSIILTFGFMFSRFSTFWQDGMFWLVEKFLDSTENLKNGENSKCDLTLQHKWWFAEHLTNVFSLCKDILSFFFFTKNSFIKKKTGKTTHRESNNLVKYVLWVIRTFIQWRRKQYRTMNYKLV